MSVQARRDNSNLPFILDAGLYFVEEEIVLKEDAGRLADLVFGTILSKEAATGKWVPVTDLNATDGTGIPRAVYTGADIPAADIVAGDVEGLKAIVGGGNVLIDEDQVVFENALTFDSLHQGGTVNAKTARDLLSETGLNFKKAVETTQFEN